MGEPSIAFCRGHGGARIAYATWGEGPVLVVVPGWLSHLELQWHYLGMHDLYARLARSFQLVFYDRRGVGLSQRARDDFELEGELEDLDAVIARVTDGPVAMFGSSHGGAIALAYAATRPERVSRLALYGTFARGADVARVDVQRSLDALVRASWGLGSRTLASIFVPNAPDPAFFDNLVRFQRESADRETAARLLAMCFELDVRDRLRDVRAPTLVVARRHDHAIASRLSIELASEIDGARLVMLEGDVHFPWLGDWPTIAQLLEDFLERRPAARPSEPPPATRDAPSETWREFRVLHYRVSRGPEESAFRVALAQIGEPADMPQPGASGLYRLAPERVDAVRAKLASYVARAAERGARIVVFPEMSVDLGHDAIAAEVHELARAHGVTIVSGGHHDEATRTNVCVVIGPEGELWRQRKHVPAIMRMGGAVVEEPIDIPLQPLFVVASTRIGRVAIAVCRDFLDLDLRVALKNTEPPLDLLINPAFTAVTSDFETAHAEARRALYACTLFCNFAAFGGSLATSPDKSAARVVIPRGEERLEVLDVPLFEMRAERRAWDERAHARFVQSTRRA
ncbi:alpha/beta fold hydrolase [Sandaracinus amylolyticus]|uniref:Transcriptional regulator, CadC protein n=1 Tax=Sandaracinus amylolyticus TaxID=927083 RepID=A0A0F6W1V8_9BACT|nr:alpha/beta fold hydrolase [Sandaracinus amylolyticus]AKF05140.1 Transcriptional regulator, CadC protein [Sandaracinus amylolyticus]